MDSIVDFVRQHLPEIKSALHKASSELGDSTEAASPKELLAYSVGLLTLVVGAELGLKSSSLKDMMKALDQAF